MRHFTLFTLLYLAAAVCLTTIAIQHSDITPDLRTILLFNAGILYLEAVFSTFTFWRQALLRSQARLHNKPAWRRNFATIAPWLIFPLMLATAIPDLVSHNWAMGAIARESVWLILILGISEQLLLRSQIRQ